MAASWKKADYLAALPAGTQPEQQQVDQAEQRAISDLPQQVPFGDGEIRVHKFDNQVADRHARRRRDQGTHYTLQLYASQAIKPYHAQEKSSRLHSGGPGQIPFEALRREDHQAQSDSHQVDAIDVKPFLLLQAGDQQLAA